MVRNGWTSRQALNGKHISTVFLNTPLYGQIPSLQATIWLRENKRKKANGTLFTPSCLNGEESSSWQVHDS
jgi:hypothetical protein